MPPSSVLPVSRTIEARESRLGSLLGVQIHSLASYTPQQVVTNADLAILGHDPEWVWQRSGIRTRRHAAADQATSDLAVEAARRCLARGEIDPADVDLVLVATYTPDFAMPATASIVQDKLGLTAMAFDIQAACAGFVFALLTGMQYVATGCSKRALVIGADCNSRIVDPADRQTYPLFGDGAGAVLLARGDRSQGAEAFAVGSDGSGADLLVRPLGGSRLPRAEVAADDPRWYLQMAGRPVFKWAVRMLVDTSRAALCAAGRTLDDVALMVVHQANARIIAAAVEGLGIDPARVYNTIERYGNTSAASIPLGLDEAAAEGRLHRGDLVLVSGFGGGLAWGTMLLRW